jgi:hypothetical protein
VRGRVRGTHSLVLLGFTTLRDMEALKEYALSKPEPGAEVVRFCLYSEGRADRTC